jgi:hypothetical protein
MQFLQTNATDLNGLLIAMRNFLTANGWTTLADGTGGGGLTLEMTNANGHDFQFTSSTNAATVYVGVGGTGSAFNDRLLKCAFQKADIGLSAGYTAKPAITNDMAGPFPNIWFFTDDAATYCHVVMQTGNARYNHFSFGNVDNKGLHAVNLPYAFGCYHIWWQWNPYFTGNSADACAFTDFSAGSHNIGFYCEEQNSEDINFAGTAARIGLPDGVVDPTLGFTDGPLEAALLRQTMTRYCVQTIPGDSAGLALDFLDYYDNQGYTGGVPIFPVPLVVRNIAGTVHTQVGEWPGIGSVNVDGLSPSQELDFAGEVWMVFPIKQKGTYAAKNNGANPAPFTNTLNYGIAVKKVDA